MKKFNIENNKISIPKKVKKYLLITGAIILVVGIAIGLSFASYTVESEGYVVINSKVGEFSLSDIQIAVVVDGVTQDTFPTKGSGYVFESVTCENGSTGTWDSTNWQLNMVVKGPDECTVSFVERQGTLVSEYIISLLSTNTATMNNDDPDGNVRYMGANPNNYVSFNGESWRIIGVFDVASSASGTKEKRVKLIRAAGFNRKAWDSSASGVNSGWGVNEWSQADIMTTLNSGAYYNRTSGTCYSAENDGTESCDFSSTGLTSEAKALIGDAYWHTGTIDGVTNSYSNSTAPTFYAGERSTNTGKICSSGTYCNDTVTRKTGWVGQVGLIYPSDYGYSTSGGSTTNRATCLSTALYDWDGSSDCYSNSWLLSSSYGWTMTSAPNSSLAYNVFYVNYAGYVNDYPAANGDADQSREAPLVNPVVYLDSSVLITGGDGTSESPYTIGL